MNMKEMLFIVVLALVTTWGIEYLFFGKRSAETGDQEVKAGQSFVAPKHAKELRPLETEVDFVDTKHHVPTVTTELETDYALLTFSTDGASLEQLAFKRQLDGWPQNLMTIFPLADTEKERRCFLVGIDQATPYFYNLVENKDIGDAFQLVYEAVYENGTITKIFTVFKHTYKINLKLTLTPKGQAPVHARIFLASPIIQDIAAEDAKAGLMTDEKGNVVSVARAKINTDTFWVAPTLFGADDRYVVFAMVTDPAQFTQRAYFTLFGHNDMMGIIEGPAVTNPTSWELSFYFGPKEHMAMAAVDPRLENTLGYAGWFAPIAKWLLKLLNFLHDLLGNYGWAIIALTILTKLVLLPFSIKSANSMKKHGEVQKKLKYIQQKYKDNPEVLAQERAELMKKEGLTSLAGCLPLLLQLPIFFALSRVLSTSIELYQAPFVLWITDLSAKDPYYILPGLVGLSMLMQAATMDQSQRIQLIVMAIVFSVITATLSAGLCLYIFMSTFLSVGQTIIQKRFKSA